MDRGHNKGFTLVEVLITVVIAALSFVGIYAFSSQCMRQIWLAREMSRAASVIEYEMDTLCTTAWSNITAVTNYTISPVTNLALVNLSNANGTVTFSPAGNVRTATVAVVWSSRRGTLSTTGTCVIAENGFAR